ncbi:MAG: protein-glutamate O-methyltransferase CheR [Maricaulaceae bacterium]|jgi:chemotaxis protein methyltransferase CheR
MTPSDVEIVSTLVRRRAGIALTPDKGYLLENRLAPVARREGFETISAMIAALQTRRDPRLADLVADAMATKETYFFRDKTPFDHFSAHMLPSLLAARAPGEKIRIWSAGCSTGQEPYSLAMLVASVASKLAGRTVEIVATDLCRNAIEKAKAGVYSHFEVQRGLPIRMLVEHFDQHGETWRVHPDVKRFVSFRQHNLLDEMDELGRFDVVLCRNVLCAFDAKVRQDVLGRIAEQMEEGGFLLLGVEEDAAAAPGLFTPVTGRAGLYERTEADREAA